MQQNWTVDDVASLGAAVGIFAAHALAYNILARDHEFFYIGMIAAGAALGAAVFYALGRALGRPKVLIQD